MSGRQGSDKAVARVLAKMAAALDGDRPDGEMTEAARIGLICQFIPGQPDLFDEVFPATPEITELYSRAEYADALRRAVR